MEAYLISAEGSIELTAHDDALFRFIRLGQVVGYVYAKRGWHLLRLIRRLHDHKGILTVTWFEQPTDEERNTLNEAWASPIGDGDVNVEHKVGPS